MISPGVFEHVAAVRSETDLRSKPLRRLSEHPELVPVVVATISRRFWGPAAIALKFSR